MASSTPTLNAAFTTIETYALLALTQKTLHAYGVREQIAYDSVSQVVPAMGTLYPLLRRMVKRRWVEEVWADGRVGVKVRYRLTERGRQQLGEEFKRLRQVLAHARYKLGPRLV